MNSACSRCSELEMRVQELEKQLLAQNEELSTAADMQRSLLPAIAPHLSGIAFAAECHQAVGVGGDFYDCWQTTGSRLSLLIADVSGHGLSAALMAAQLRTILRRELLMDRSDLGAKIASLNEIVHETSPLDRYATLFYGELDLDNLTLRYVNAGHPSPILLRSSFGKVDLSLLTEGGLPLGLFKEPPLPYGFGECFLLPGDVLLAFSDGVTEAQDLGGNAFGIERVQSVLTGMVPGTTADLVVSRLLENVVAFCEGTTIADDITVLALKIQPD